MAKVLVTDEARREFSNLRRAFDEVNTQIQTKFSQLSNKFHVPNKPGKKLLESRAFKTYHDHSNQAMEVDEKPTQDYNDIGGLEKQNMKKFFYYIQLPNFDIAADAAATFKELLIRHKSTVAEFLIKNEDWFFADYNSKLLESSNYITRRQAIKLLGDILLDRSNSAVMTKYVSSMDNLRILRESSKIIQIDAFHVFKVLQRVVEALNWKSEIIMVLKSQRALQVKLK
ncbi:unnamed protein product [Eruca vesicaria subsp. sativa]|uniref:Uncharacterized protein n=1 Tax=Eruca vesicaria subsp. sativa TaxID=29727 RepID=A0ABC8KDF6_ERUVS|nr:unnamed protein product [Eruca vesicaria subsp. sativa]